MASSVKRKKARKKWLILLLFLLIGGGVSYPLWFGKQKEKFVIVQTEKVQRRTITQVVTASGKIQPETQVKINAEVSGEIVDIAVKEGQKVKRGALLVRIKPDQYQAQVDRAEAALASTKALLSLQAANWEKAKTEFRRMQDLCQKQLASDQDFVSAKIAEQIARAQHESAQSNIAQSLASLKEAKENLAKTSIYAPMEGIVSQVKSETGERVSGSTFTQGTEMMTIADLSLMEARVDVGESDIVLLNIGNVAQLDVDAYPERKFKGVVAKIGNTAKTKSAGTQDEVTNFEVKIRIVERNISFRPGMSVTADIETQTRPNVLSVPIQSVTTRQPPKPKEAKPGLETPKDRGGEKPQEVVFVMEQDKAKMLQVKRGICDETYVEIQEGLEENMEVVSGSYKAINRELEDGCKIKVETPKQPGTAK